MIKVKRPLSEPRIILPAQSLVTSLQLGHLLRSARKHRKMTQKQVAVRLGLSQNRVSHLENHPDELSFEQLLVWVAVVGLELRLGEREPPITSEW